MVAALLIIGSTVEGRPQAEVTGQKLDAKATGQIAALQAAKSGPAASYSAAPAAPKAQEYGARNPSSYSASGSQAAYAQAAAASPQSYGGQQASYQSAPQQASYQPQAQSYQPAAQQQQYSSYGQAANQYAGESYQSGPSQGASASSYEQQPNTEYGGFQPVLYGTLRPVNRERDQESAYAAEEAPEKPVYNAGYVHDYSNPSLLKNSGKGAAAASADENEYAGAGETLPGSYNPATDLLGNMDDATLLELLQNAGASGSEEYPGFSVAAAGAQAGAGNPYSELGAAAGALGASQLYDQVAAVQQYAPNAYNVAPVRQHMPIMPTNYGPPQMPQQMYAAPSAPVPMQGLGAPQFHPGFAGFPGAPPKQGSFGFPVSDMN